MKTTPRTVAILFAGLLLSGSLQFAPALAEDYENPAHEDQVASAIETAEAARQQAAAAGFEWLQTRSLIANAREAAGNGEWQLALTLADEARLQGELAVEQAKRESEAWRGRVVR